MCNGNRRSISIERHGFVLPYVLVLPAQHTQGSCTVALAPLGIPRVCHRLPFAAAY